MFISDESDRCESSRSGDDKEESGIEQDFEPNTDKQVVNANINHCATERKKKIDTPCDARQTGPTVPLTPINLNSHLKRDDGIKKLDSIRYPGIMHQTGSKCSSSSEKPSSFTPTSSSKTQNSSYRSQYQRKPLDIAPVRQPRRNKAPELFENIIIKDRFRARSQYSSPLKKGILKNANGSKYSTTGVKYSTIQEKNNLAPFQGMALICETICSLFLIFDDLK